MEYSKISVIGLGYIGLPTAAILASCGVDVLNTQYPASIKAKFTLLTGHSER